MFEETKQPPVQRLKAAAIAVFIQIGRIRRRLRSLAFWDYSQVWVGKRERLPPDEITLGSVGQFRSLQDVQFSLFSEGRTSIHDKSLDVVSSLSDARELVHQNLIEGRNGPLGVLRREIFGYGTYSLDDFLAQRITGALQIRGRVFFRLHFDTVEDRIYLTGFENLRREDLKRVRLGRNRGRYRYVVRNQYAIGSIPPNVEYIQPDDVAAFVLEPPFAATPGKARLKQAQRLARKKDKLNSAMLAAAHASAYPDDHRWWVERARWLNSTKLHAELEHLELRISSVMGGMAGMMWKPMTRFYQVYDFLSFRYRVAILRESLLEQLNQQVVRRLLERNGLPADAASVVAVGLRSSDEWKEALDQFIDGRMQYEEAQQLLFPSTKAAGADTGDGAD